jgi:hypothetical protein
VTLNLLNDAELDSAPLALTKHHYNQVGGVCMCYCFLIVAWLLNVRG